jgi:transposase-like protein
MGQQKRELVMASLGGERNIAEICREHQIRSRCCGAGISRWRRRASG